MAQHSSLWGWTLHPSWECR